MRTVDLQQAREPSAPDRSGMAPHADGDAWRREMERLAMQSWFHGALPKASEAPAAGALGAGQEPDLKSPGIASAPTRVGRAARVELAGYASSPPPPPASGQASGSLRQEMGAALATTSSAPIARPVTDPAQTPPLNAASVSVGKSGLAGRSPSAAPDFAPSSTAAPPSSAPAVSAAWPISVHIEDGPTGAKVWLGVPLHRGVDVAAIQVAVGRWLTRQGYGRADWICNGEPIASPGHHNELNDVIKEIS